MALKYRLHDQFIYYLNGMKLEIVRLSRSMGLKFDSYNVSDFMWFLEILQPTNV